MQTGDGPHYSVGVDPWLQSLEVLVDLCDWQTGGVHTFFMQRERLQTELARIRKTGFDDSFARFCAETFSSFSYSTENLPAARMHAFFLRLFLDGGVNGTPWVDAVPERLRILFEEVSMKAVEETLSSEAPSGVRCCRSFVRRWCEALSLCEDGTGRNR